MKSGFWLRKGKVTNVMGNGGNVVLGTRTRFIFSAGSSIKNAKRTDWVLYEYALVDHPVVRISEPFNFISCF